MHASIGLRVPFRYALVNGWYFNATPIPSPRLLARVLWHGRARAVRTLYNALVRVGRDPAAADRAVLAGLYLAWRDEQLPRYRALAATAETQAETADRRRLVALVDELGCEAGIALWFLAIVGGSAWKMEACLTRFARQHLTEALPDADGGAQVLLRGLPGTRYTPAPYAVHSIDWYHPLAGELPAATASGSDRHAGIAALREAAEQRCTAALADRPELAAQFQQLLRVNQRYAEIRETQARELTLAWPALRTCTHRLGRHLADAAVIDQPDDVYFCTHDELLTALTEPDRSLTATIAERRHQWQRQRRLAAPLTLGRPPRLIGDVIARAVAQARGAPVTGDAVIVGHPASAGRATGPVHIVQGPQDFATFTDGAVLVAKATAPAWTPLFGRAAAVVTDGGTFAAHASLIAREYGIPAVVGTADATHRLTSGRLVTVDGTAGVVILHPEQDGQHLA
ncbi:PEP-utilizing enzyme [Dactylosporangium sp. McL0621]|uniref:PEP-utilizing enzyme n=1 Tax=Dactylosporangium sp. McL0621 TaxID=3415678 RepID=UPI003CF6D090